jgi:hypothetical protein
MAETETIRIATMNEDERTIINVLSHQERKEALLKAGEFKMQNANNRLFIKQLLETPEFGKAIRLWLEEIGRSLQDVTNFSLRSPAVEGPPIDGWATYEPGPFIFITLYFADGQRAQRAFRNGTQESF